MYAKTPLVASAHILHLMVQGRDGVTYPGSSGAAIKTGKVRPPDKTIWENNQGAMGQHLKKNKGAITKRLA